MITLIYAGNGRSRYKIWLERKPATGPKRDGSGGGGGAILLWVQRLVLVLELALPSAHFRLDATDLEKTFAMVVSPEIASSSNRCGKTVSQYSDEVSYDDSNLKAIQWAQ